MGNPVQVTKTPSVYIVFSIAAVAFAVRLAVIFLVIPIDYRWESYHLWEIAYYTLKVGFAQGRMWDLEGLEYFWGPVPILSESFLLWVLNTTSILPFRILNGAAGALSCVLAHLVGAKYYSSKAGLLAAFLVALNPISLFNNTIAMTETFSVLFLLLGIYFYREHQFYAGLALALASLSRTELWAISIGIIATYLIFERDLEKMVPCAAGWFVGMLPYFYAAGTATGNPFYSFYWNFIGNIAGVWTPWHVAPEFRVVFAILLVGSIVGLLWMIRNRKRIGSYIIPVIFLAFVAYHGLSYTFSGVAPLFERFFIFDVAIGAILLAFLTTKLKVGFKAIAVGLILLQLVAVFVTAPYYVGLQSDITGLYSVADQIGPKYTGGTILSDMPMITYRLIDHWGISEQHIVGTIYMPTDTPQNTAQWLKSHDVNWLVVADPKGQRALSLIQDLAGQNAATSLHLIYTYSGASVYEIDLKAMAISSARDERAQFRFSTGDACNRAAYLSIRNTIISFKRSFSTRISNTKPSTQRKMILTAETDTVW